MLHLEDRPAFQMSLPTISLRVRDLRSIMAPSKPTNCLKEKLALYAENQRVLLLLRERTLNDASRMCVELAKAAGRQCVLNLPPPTFD